MLKLISSAMFFCLICLGCAHSPEVDGLSGYYESPGSRCTSADGHSCAADTVDCLRIVPASNRRVMIELFSTQANMHVCSLTFQAEVVGDRLVSVSDERNEKGGAILVELQPDRFIVRDTSRGPISQYCGAYASLEGLAFLRSSKAADRQCSRDQ